MGEGGRFKFLPRLEKIQDPALSRCTNAYDDVWCLATWPEIGTPFYNILQLAYSLREFHIIGQTQNPNPLVTGILHETIQREDVTTMLNQACPLTCKSEQVAKWLGHSRRSYTTTGQETP